MLLLRAPAVRRLRDDQSADGELEGRGAILNKKDLRSGARAVRLHPTSTAACRAARPSACACRRPTSVRSRFPTPRRRAGAVPLRHPADRLQAAVNAEIGRELDGRDLRRRTGRADGGGRARLLGAETHLHGRPPRLSAASSRPRPTASMPIDFDEIDDPAEEIIRRTRSARRRRRDRRGRLRGEGQHESRPCSTNSEARGQRRQRRCAGRSRRLGAAASSACRASTPASSTASCSATPSRRGSRSAWVRRTSAVLAPELLGRIEAGGCSPERIMTHQLPLAEAPRGYEIFDEKKRSAARSCCTRPDGRETRHGKKEGASSGFGEGMPASWRGTARRSVAAAISSTASVNLSAEPPRDEKTENVSKRRCERWGYHVTLRAPAR